MPPAILCRLFLAYALLTTASAAGQDAPTGEPPEPPEPPASPEVRALCDASARQLFAERYEQSLETARRAAAVARERSDGVGEAKAAYRQACSLEKLGRREEAAQLFRASAELSGTNDDPTGRVRSLLSLAQLSRLEAPAGKDLLESALREAGAEQRRPLAMAAVLEEFADQQRVLGSDPVARQLFQAALRLAERAAPRGSSHRLYRLGQLHAALSDPEQASSYQAQARASAVKLPDTLPTAALLLQLGRADVRFGDYFAAEGSLLRAELIYRQTAPAALEYGTVLRELGDTAVHRRDRAAAVAFYLAAARVYSRWPEASGELATLHQDVAAFQRSLGDYEGADRNLRAALSIWQKEAPESRWHASAYVDLGRLALARRDLPRAREHAEHARALLERTAPASATTAGCLDLLGRLKSAEGDYPAALALHRRAIALGERLAPSSVATSTALTTLASVLLASGDAPGAEREAARAWKIYRDLAPAAGAPESRQALFEGAAGTAALLLRSQVEQGKTMQALETLEQSRAQALRQLLEERDLAPTPADRALWRRYHLAARRRDRQYAGLLLTQRAFVKSYLDSQRAPATGAVRPAEELKEQAAAHWLRASAEHALVRAEAEQLWAELRTRRRGPGALKTAAKARTALPPGTLFLSFHLHASRLYVFAVHGDAARAPGVHRVETSRDGMRAEVEAFRTALAERSLTAVEQGRLLFQRLFPAALRQEMARARRLILSPHRHFWSLPFAALVVNEAGPPQYLGLVKPLSYTPSLVVLAEGHRAPRQLPARSVVAVGDPTFTPSSVSRVEPAPRADTERSLLLGGQSPQPLPATRQEAARVAALYGQQPLLGERATEAAVRKRLPAADLIHLATHGYFDPAQLGASGVLLAAGRAAAAEETGDDGVLQAWEIGSQLRLRADLVVLSACETARGKALSADGLLGLTRAFQSAGARSVVAGQWKVPDSGTYRLMVTFHEALKRGVPKDEALRRAAEVTQRGAATSHPYYWAAFTLLGDPAGTVAAPAAR